MVKIKKKKKNTMNEKTFIYALTFGTIVKLNIKSCVRNRYTTNIRIMIDYIFLHWLNTRYKNKILIKE